MSSDIVKLTPQTEYSEFEKMWVVAYPGALTIPETAYLLRYMHGSSYPYFVEWNNGIVTDGILKTLSDAKERAFTHMKQMFALGITP